MHSSPQFLGIKLLYVTVVIFNQLGRLGALDINTWRRVGIDVS